MEYAPPRQVENAPPRFAAVEVRPAAQSDATYTRAREPKVAARGLEYYAGWARQAKSDEFPLAASAARSAAGAAPDFAARSMINMHGGIGATWSTTRRCSSVASQLSRRLLGGTHDATDRVAEQTLVGAAA